MPGKILVHLLQGTNETLRWTAARELGKMRYRRGVPFLVKKLQDKKEVNYIREEVAMTLGILGNANTSKLLLQIFLNEGEPEDLRVNCGVGLGLIGNGHVSQSLLRAMESPNIRIRQAAINSLGQFGYPPAALPIMDILQKTEDPDLRLTCIIALGNMRRKAGQIATLLMGLLEKGSDFEEEIKDSLRKLLPNLKREQKEEVARLVNS